MTPGTICTIRNRRGRWVVSAAIRHGELVPLFRDDGLVRLGIAAGAGDLTVIVPAPTFELGEKVRYTGGSEPRSAIVVKDAGGPTVRLRYHAPHELRHGGRVGFRDREADADRAGLVADNLHKFI